MGATLQETLNDAWEVKPDPGQGGIKAFLMKRVFSLGMILGIGFILLVSLAWIYYEAVKLSFRIAVLLGGRE